MVRTRGLALVLAVFAVVPAHSASVFPGASWEVRTPAEVGLNPALVDAFASNLGGDGVIVKNGYLIKTWGSHTGRGDWASSMKPVMSTLLFFAVEEGLVASVDEGVRPWVLAQFGDDLIPKDTTMTWRHLADMVSGYARGEPPGEAWAYNDYAIQLYSRLLFDAVYGVTPDEVASSRFAPLGLEDGGVFGSRGGRGVNASVRDFARIAWLWLNAGHWDGAQLLPRWYFDRYRRPDVALDLPRTALDGSDYLGVGTLGGGSDQHAHGPGIYGFNWWLNAETPAGGPTWPDAPLDTFMATGHWNDECVLVIPSLQLVVASRGSWGSWDPGNPDAGMNRNIGLLVAAASGPVGALDGQISVDPVNPEWLERRGAGSVFIVGPGDPEGFLYRGARNPDGTRDGDQLALIDKLREFGGNSIYLQVIRSHGGDGGADHNPFVDSVPSLGLEEAILDQWEVWFTALDAAGVVIHLFFYDDSARIWDTGDVVGPEERAFLEALVARFKHHLNLVWVVAEEYSERYTPARVSAVAGLIREADEHAHPIAVHQLNGLGFDFPDDPNIDQFAIQYNVDSPGELHDGMLTAWTTAAGRYGLNMSEAANHGSGVSMRRKNWAVAMGGAYVMVLGMDIAATSEADLADCRIQQQFFEATDFSTMAPHDELAAGGTEYVLARPGASYLAYAGTLTGEIGLRAMTRGEYDLSWLDIPTGTLLTERSVSVTDGDQSWPTPAGFGDELALWIRVAEPPCAGSLGRVTGLRVVKEPVGDSAFVWDPATGAPGYHLNGVTLKGDVDPVRAHRPPIGVADSACETAVPACTVPAAPPEPSLRFFQVFAACGDDGAAEGPF